MSIYTEMTIEEAEQRLELINKILEPYVGSENPPLTLVLELNKEENKILRHISETQIFIGSTEEERLQLRRAVCESELSTISLEETLSAELFK